MGGRMAERPALLGDRWDWVPSTAPTIGHQAKAVVNVSGTGGLFQAMGCGRGAERVDCLVDLALVGPAA